MVNRKYAYSEFVFKLSIAQEPLWLEDLSEDGLYPKRALEIV